jgi:hypothetical protein
MGQKEYTLKINGIDVSIKDVTKLEAAVTSLDAALGKVSNATVKVTGAAKESAKALSDEEKAEQKLNDTLNKVAAARSGANKAQIEANQALREATREQTLQVRAEQAAANSIEGMRVKLSQLKDEWKGLDVGTEEFRNMSAQILELNDRIKDAEQSTGDFRRNVGNYQSALDGLGKLSNGIEGVSKSSMGLAQGLLGANALMSMFGEQSEENAKRAQQLQKIIALLSIAQQVNTNILKEGIIQNKLGVVTDTIRTAQLKAKTAAEAASTKGTIAATVAQKIFNIVASANPYVLLALALVAVGTALFVFSRNTKSAADKQKELNDQVERGRKLLDSEAEVLTRYSQFRQDSLQRQIDYLKTVADAEAKNGVISKKRLDEIRKLEDKLNEERKRHAREMANRYKEDIDALDKNKDKLVELQNQLRQLNPLKGKGVEVPINIDGKELIGKADKAIELVQQEIDKTQKSINVALDVIDLKSNANAASANAIKQREKEDKDRAKAASDAAKQRADTELSITRAAEDARIKLIQNSNEQARKALALTYDRQIEDIHRRLTTEKELTAKARTALNETVISLEKQKALDLEKLEKEQAGRALALQQEVEDSRIALIVGNYDRQTAEINLQYDRQIAAYKKRLDEDKTLTEKQQNQITELILNAQKARGAALSKLTADQLNQQADQQLTAVEDALKKVEREIGRVIVRSKTGLELIDVDKTRQNLAKANAALDEYIAGLKTYLKEVEKAHEAMLATLQEGTAEYEAELQNYARTFEDVTDRINKAQKDQEVNTKRSAKVQTEALHDAFSKIGEYADALVTAFSSVFDTWSMALQVQVDDLNEQLDALNEKYEEAQKLRESAVKNVETIEARMRAATGGTVEALKVQLQDAMHARGDAEREEQRLAKEKEKREAEIAKKEKQIRRNDLVMDIVQAIADTAAGVAKALKAVPPPFNFVLAAMVGAAGAVQVGIMTKQLTKLAEGGEITGPSHAAGGARIHGTNIEVEGGEYVINKETTGKNKGLIRFINSQRKELKPEDISAYFSTPPRMVASPFKTVFAEGGQLPHLADDTAPVIDYEQLAEAMSAIKIRPVVSVTDINRVSDEVVTVKDLAGF